MAMTGTPYCMLSMVLEPVTASVTQTMVAEHSFVLVSDDNIRRTTTPIHVSQVHHIHLYPYPTPASNHEKLHEDISKTTCLA